MMKLAGSAKGGPGKRPRVRRLRTVAVFPTTLTLGNMLCGFAAVYLCMLGLVDQLKDQPIVKDTLNSPLIENLLPTYLSVAGFLIFLGMIFDMMDGRVARMTTGKTNFGGQIDSLADMVTFGVAPGILVITMVMVASKNVGDLFVSVRMGWVAGAIFASCTALRLARFNVEHAESDLKHTAFHGLPSPAAASVVASLIILFEHVAEVRGKVLVNVLPFVTIAVGLLMVSRVRYTHVGNTYLRGRQPFGRVAISLMVVAGLLIRFPAPMLAILAGAYALSGPVLPLVHRFRGQPRRTEASDSADNAASTRRKERA